METRDAAARRRRLSPPPGALRAIHQTAREMTPREFIALSAEERSRVVRVEPVPARLGEVGFGRIRVYMR